MDVVLSKNSKIFHQTNCTYVHRMKHGNQRVMNYADALRAGYVPCSCCSFVNGLTKKLKNDGFDSSWDGIRDGCCIRTDVGFWKIKWEDFTKKWVLYHMNSDGSKCFDPSLSNEELMNGAFHRQLHVKPTRNIEDFIRYIGSHEHSVRVKNGDYRNLPKKWRNAEKNRKKRKGLREVRKLIKQIERERLEKEAK